MNFEQFHDEHLGGFRIILDILDVPGAEGKGTQVLAFARSRLQDLWRNEVLVTAA
jgi:hypothetical protein